jgi:beta-lactamase class A
MRLAAIFFWVFAFVAQPALAASSPSLQPLEQRLAWIAAANPADVGIAAIDLATGEYVSVNGDTPYPMASTVKVAIAANYLAQVEYGRRSLDDRIGGRSARGLIEAMLVRSDNPATDLLLWDLGGPRVIQSWLDQHGLSGIRVDRNIAQLLAARRDLQDVRDSSTPRAMVELLRRLDSGTMINPASRAYLFDTMGRCITGRNRIRGLLPSYARVQNKTGTLNGLSTDVGYLTLPDGRRVAIAVFARYGSDRPRVIAEAARAVYEGFAAHRPFYPAAAYGAH